jgi:Domain of unknown function (DUF4124)
MKRYLLAFLVMMWASSAVAETWQWVDGRGTASFTDDPQNIPTQYRKAARKIGGEIVPTPGPAVLAEAAEQVSAPTSPPGGPAPQAASDAKLQRYGGRTAAQWQEAFSSLNSELRGVDGELKEKQRLLKEPGTLSRSDYLKLEDEIRRLNSRLTVLLGRWELLNRDATAASLPEELRR